MDNWGPLGDRFQNAFHRDWDQTGNLLMKYNYATGNLISKTYCIIVNVFNSSTVITSSTIRLLYMVIV